MCRPRTTSLLGPSCLLQLPLQLHSLPGRPGQQQCLTEAQLPERDIVKHRLNQNLSDIAAAATASAAGWQSWLRELCAARAAHNESLTVTQRPALIMSAASYKCCLTRSTVWDCNHL